MTHTHTCMKTHKHTHWLLMIWSTHQNQKPNIYFSMQSEPNNTHTEKKKQQICQTHWLDSKITKCSHSRVLAFWREKHWLKQYIPMVLFWTTFVWCFHTTSVLLYFYLILLLQFSFGCHNFFLLSLPHLSSSLCQFVQHLVEIQSGQTSRLTPTRH